MNFSADDFYQKDVGELHLLIESVNLLSLQRYRLPICLFGNLKERNPYWKQLE